jgi:CSLREA domain-containing protein
MVCAVCGAFAPAALAATFTVNTTSDTSDAGGCTSATVCSLRDAVAAANAAPGSTIDLQAAHYTLNTGASPLGQLDLTAATTIAGAGARSTIVDGNGLSRVFDFEPATDTDILTLEGLTVTGGSAPATALMITDPGDGGGIFSNGGLDLEHVAVTGNTAALGGGGIMDGTIHSTTPGPATFNGVTIADNKVQGGGANGQGGGAVVATTLTMTNSTIADNEVDNAGVNEGGGLVNSIGNTSGDTTVSATLVNDTIVGNVATEPVAAPAGDLGGGISGDQLAEVDAPFDSVIDSTNTIVAGNTADGAEQDCALVDTTDGTSSHNIEGDATCGFTDPASKQTTAIELGKLADNGGPTDTLLPTSPTAPEVNTGTSTGCPSTDQRGVTRPQGSACDIGSVELAPPTATTGAASATTLTSTTVSGKAGNPAVLAGTAAFDYGTTTSYGHTAAAGSAPAGPTSSAVSATLSGLTPNTTYHYKLVVTTTDGTASGADATFKTPPVPTSTSVTCVPRSVPTGQSSVCTAKVTGQNAGGTSTLPSGTVRFSASGGLSGRCTLSAKVTCTAKLAIRGNAGARTVTAAYGGNSIYAASSGSEKLTVKSICPKPSGAISGIHVGAAQLGLTRAAERKRFYGYSTRGRKQFDFFCSNDHQGIRVGYSGGRAVLVLTSNPLYHLGAIRPGSKLATAERDLKIYTHFKLGLNTWYLSSGGAAAGVLKVRHGQVQEIGIAVRSRTRTLKAARHLFANIP